MQVGDSLPTDITLPDQHGDPVDFAGLVGTPLVLYFYPRDNTPGCTAQACGFRDQYEEFQDAGARVIGVSDDSPQQHAAFAEKHRLPFTLLSDRGGTARKRFGIKSKLGLLPGRVTFVFDAEGKAVHVFNNQLQATKHIGEALAALA